MKSTPVTDPNKCLVLFSYTDLDYQIRSLLMKMSPNPLWETLNLRGFMELAIVAEMVTGIREPLYEWLEDMHLSPDQAEEIITEASELLWTMKCRMTKEFGAIKITEYQLTRDSIAVWFKVA